MFYIPLPFHLHPLFYTSFPYFTVSYLSLNSFLPLFLHPLTLVFIPLTSYYNFLPVFFYIPLTSYYNRLPLFYVPLPFHLHLFTPVLHFLSLFYSLHPLTILLQSLTLVFTSPYHPLTAFLPLLLIPLPFHLHLITPVLHCFPLFYNPLPVLCFNIPLPSYYNLLPLFLHPLNLLLHTLPRVSTFQ